MTFGLTPEQTELARAVRRFAEGELAAGALDRAHSREYPWALAAQLSDMGMLGITIPEADGGVGGTLMDAVITIQELAMVCPKSADVVQAGNFGPIRTFAEFASPAQKKRWLPDLLAGKKLIALGMSEPDAGSAVTELKSTAREDGDGYLVNGSKVFSTHSPHADLFLIYVRFGPGINGIGSVLVERGTPGFTVGNPAPFMSGEEWCPLYFEDCRIPAENLLLGEGGFKKQISGFNVERIGNASRALALGRHAYEVARRHTMERTQFGRPLCEFQGLQWKFSEMIVKLESAQMLLYRAARDGDENGLPSAFNTAAAKLACNEAGFDVANAAMQAMGAYGYSSESLVEYCVKRTRGWQIAGGSIEMLKNRIAEHVFERRFSQRPC
ncbi:acyl-CoA dehydrogenase [Roseivivax halodurans JCM 10272]|uniref:Acyl-CoA dehydrogenase n=1 Tax=Roseivivax halodurans JCM 10272 TaxID=1449350 RepID=X7EBD3_9RHOB|nr:acyl-CoA dehydrogenase family protein [Roseivivax halodurans]ETX13374.1 acyl-CoA dehydrogenase [Roseivivax halodurans JCM 10272]